MAAHRRLLVAVAVFEVASVLAVGSPAATAADAVDGVVACVPGTYGVVGHTPVVTTGGHPVYEIEKVLVGHTPVRGGEEIYEHRPAVVGYTPVVTTGGRAVYEHVPTVIGYKPVVTTGGRAVYEHRYGITGYTPRVTTGGDPIWSPHGIIGYTPTIRSGGDPIMGMTRVLVGYTPTIRSGGDPIMGTTRTLVGYTPMTGGEEIYGLQERLIGYTPVVTTGGDPVMGMCVGVDLCWDGTVKKRGVPCLPQAPPDETISEEEVEEGEPQDISIEDGDAMADMTLAQLALLDPPMTRCANGQLTHDKCDYPRLSGVELSGSVCAGLDGNLSASTAYGYESCTAPATDSMIRKVSGDGGVSLVAVNTYCPAHSSLVGIEVLTDPVSGAQVQACLYDCTAATLPVELSTRIYGDSTAGLVGKADYQCAEQEPVFPPPPPTTTTTPPAVTVSPSEVEETADVPPLVEETGGEEPEGVVGGPFMPVGPSVEVAESPLVDVLRDCPAMGLELAISQAGGFETYWVTFRQVVDEENGGMTWVPVEMWPLFRNYRGVWQVVVGDCVWKPTATRTITGEYYAWEPAHHEAIQRLAPEWMKQWNADWFTDEMKQRARDVWIDHGIQDRLCVMPRPDAALPGGMPGPQEPLVLEPLAGDDCELWWYPHSGPMWFQVYVIWTAEDGSQAEVAAEVGDVYVHDPLDFIIERFMWSRFP